MDTFRSQRQNYVRKPSVYTQQRCKKAPSKESALIIFKCLADFADDADFKNQLDLQNQRE